MRYSKLLPKIVSLLAVTLPGLCFASYIETTMGTAVVNDATAAYFNPAALVLLKNTQFIPLASVVRFRTQFSGRSTSVASSITEYGSTSTESDYYSPSFYFGMPLNNRFTFGLAGVSNFVNRNPEENSILRYVQSKNSIQDYDLVTSVGIKVTDQFSIGAGVNFSYVNFDLHPIFGFPGSNIADSQSNNQSNGAGVGANAGFLIRPAANILIGFNYRTITTYNQTGKSEFDGATYVVSNNYRYKLRTPARSVLSISQRLTPTFGVITTVQRIQWSITRHININSIATASGTTPLIINASVPYYMHDTWLLTIGGNYRFKPEWILRLAGTYNQSPHNSHYQVSTGDSFIIGTSVGYDINKTFTIDGGYAHAFVQNQHININGNRFLINGENQASRDVVTLKLTINV